MIRFFRKYMVAGILLILVAGYGILALLSEGTIGGADDITHYRYSRYAFQNPYFFLHHWGKPFFTALSAPFAQLGINGIRIFNVLAGTAAAYLTYRTARMLKFRDPLLAIFLVISSPLYTVLMLSGMTEILFSLVLILSIFLFLKQRYIWCALLLSFLPFVRTEGAVILPLFAVALAWQRQWRAVPFLFSGFIFYSIVGSFHFKDLLWVIHEMPYKGSARDIYGSGSLFHYAGAAGYVFGIPLTVMLLAGLIAWMADPWLSRERPRKDWILEMLVVYLPFMLYFAAHSYVWWKGLGNSVGLIRVMAAVIPSAALLGLLAWSRLMERIPVGDRWKRVAAVILGLYLITVPYRSYQIPVPLGGTQKLVKEASNWLKESDYFEHRIYYYDPFFCHFLGLSPYDEDRVRGFVYNSDEPEYNIREGEIVIWDAHFSPNEGKLPLERLMDNPGFKLVHLVRPRQSFKVLGGYDYEICIFQRIMEDDGLDNHTIRQEMIARE